MRNSASASSPNTLYLDMSSKHLAFAHNANYSSLPPLALSRRLPWRISKDAIRGTFNGSPSANLSSLIEKSTDVFSWETLTVVIGVAFDPFYEGLSVLQETLKCLEILAKQHPGELFLQTRSPLILLATPLLRAMGNAEVRFAVETIDSDVARRFLPNFPKPEDRLTAISGLKSGGVKTSLQVSPIIPKACARENIRKLVQVLQNLNLNEVVLPFEELLRDRVEPELRNLILGRPRLIVQADRIMNHELAKAQAESDRARA